MPTAPDADFATAGLPDAIDVHVHLMPDRLMQAIREALHDEVGWVFPHPTDREAIEATLQAAGVSRYVALPYAHRAGVAADLNDWVIERTAESTMAIPFATVHGEDDVGEVVEAAFEAGARGLKFQCPVQDCGPADPRLDPAFELAATYDRPILFHAGTAPMFEDNPHVGPDGFATFLESYPDVRACCAHMGAYDTNAFADLVREHANAFLDSSYVLGEGPRRDLGPAVEAIPDSLYEELSASIMYGSDYPNVTFPYDDGVKGLLALDISEAARRDLTRHTAERFLGER